MVLVQDNLGLILGMALKLCRCRAKGSKLKVRKFGGLFFSFREVTGETLVAEREGKGEGCFLPLPILNRVKCTVMLN